MDPPGGRRPDWSLGLSIAVTTVSPISRPVGASSRISIRRDGSASSASRDFNASALIRKVVTSVRSMRWKPMCDSPPATTLSPEIEVFAVRSARAGIRRGGRMTAMATDVCGSMPLSPRSV